MSGPIVSCFFFFKLEWTPVDAQAVEQVCAHLRVALSCDMVSFISITPSCVLLNISLLPYPSPPSTAASHFATGVTRSPPPPPASHDNAYLVFPSTAASHITKYRPPPSPPPSASAIAAAIFFPGEEALYTPQQSRGGGEFSFPPPVRGGPGIGGGGGGGDGSTAGSVYVTPRSTPRHAEGPSGERTRESYSNEVRIFC